MEQIKRELELATLPEMPKRLDYRIGIIGAGFIVRNCHLEAYRKAGFNPVAITSLDLEQSKEVAALHKIEKVYPDWKQLVDDKDIEIIDIAVPPHVQPDIVEYICKHAADHIKGILCQKPIAMSIKEARRIVRLGDEAGIPIAVNSNMRYDQSMRAMKRILDKGLIGKPVIASIDMRAIPDWQTFLQKYHKLEIYAMAVHHLDIFRYLFGDQRRSRQCAGPIREQNLSIPTALYSIPISTKTDLWLLAWTMCGHGRRSRVRSTITSTGVWKEPKALRKVISAGISVHRNSAEAPFVLHAKHIRISGSSRNGRPSGSRMLLSEPWPICCVQ